MSIEIKGHGTEQAAAAVDPATQLVKFRFFDETVPQHLQKPGAFFPVIFNGRREDLSPGKWYTLPRPFLESILDATHLVLTKQHDPREDGDSDIPEGEGREVSKSVTAKRFRVEIVNPSPNDIAEAMGGQRRGPGRPKTRVA